MSKRDGIRESGNIPETSEPSSTPVLLRNRLNNRVEDLDLNLKEFTAKVNTDLVGKVVNLASRTAKFVENLGLSTEYPEDGGLIRSGAEASEAITAAYEN